MNPASVMKLVTAFAALERPGPAHTWTTCIASDGDPRGGCSKATSTSSVAPIRCWATTACGRCCAGCALGVERVTGDIVLDGSTLRLPPHDPDAFDGRGLRPPYNSGPHGLLLHHNTLLLGLHPGKTANEPVTLAAEPPLAGLVIDNRVLTADAPAAPGTATCRPRSNPAAAWCSAAAPAARGPRTWSARAAATGRVRQRALVAALGARSADTWTVRRRPPPPTGAEELFTDDSGSGSPTWCAT